MPSCTTWPPSIRTSSASWSTCGTPRPAKTRRFPLDDRSALEIITTPRPQLTAPQSRYAYFPDTAEVPEQQAVNVRNRSYTIGALVDIPAPGAEGVLFAHGSRFGGHALYVKDNRLHYVYNFVGMLEQKIDGNQDLPVGRKPNPVGILRQGRRGSRRGSPPGSCRCTTGTPRSARRGSRPSPGCSHSQVRASASDGTAARRSPADYPTGSRASLHRRHDQAGRRRRQRRRLHRPRTRGPSHARAGVTPGARNGRGGNREVPAPAQQASVKWSRPRWAGKAVTAGGRRAGRPARG